MMDSDPQIVVKNQLLQKHIRMYHELCSLQPKPYSSNEALRIQKEQCLESIKEEMNRLEILRNGYKVNEKVCFYFHHLNLLMLDCVMC